MGHAKTDAIATHPERMMYTRTKTIDETNSSQSHTTMVVLLLVIFIFTCVVIVAIIMAVAFCCHRRVLKHQLKNYVKRQDSQTVELLTGEDKTGTKTGVDERA